MRFAKPTKSTTLALLLALIASSPRPVAAAGLVQPSDGSLAPTVESFGSLIENEFVAEPSLAPRSSLPLVDLQSAPEAEIGVPLYEQDLQQRDFGFLLLPQGLIYRSYLGGPKEPRMAAGIVSIPDDSNLWDATIGGRLGMFRIGNSDPIRPRGFRWTSRRPRWCVWTFPKTSTSAAPTIVWACR